MKIRNERDNVEELLVGETGAIYTVSDVSAVKTLELVRELRRYLALKIIRKRLGSLSFLSRTQTSVY